LGQMGCEQHRSALAAELQGERCADGTEVGSVGSRRQGEGETRRHGERKTLLVSPSPCLLVSPSLCLLVSPSPCLLVCRRLYIKPKPKRVVRVKDERRLTGHERRAGDARNDLPVCKPHGSFEDAADDALLPPDFSFAQLAVGDQAGKLGAGAGAARGTVVGPT